MSTIQSNRNSGAARKAILPLSIIATVLLVTVVMFPALPIRLTIRHTESLVPISKSTAEGYHFRHLIRDRYSAGTIRKQILGSPWASSHIRRRLGLSLVNRAAFYKRPAVLRMLLSLHAPVNGLRVVAYGDPVVETTPLDTAVTAEHPDLEIVRILLAAGADPFQAFSDGSRTPSSPFKDALVSHDPELIKIFKTLKQPKEPSAANGAATLPAAASRTMPNTTGR